MKTFIKLLLLAAVALPAWSTTAAQEVSGELQILDAEEMLGEPTRSGQQMLERRVVKQVATNSTFANPKQSPRHKADGNAPAVFVQTDNKQSGTICNTQTTTNQYLPVYSYYFENSYTESQWIYPADTYLTGTNGIFNGLQGIKINAISFYAATDPIPSYVTEAEVYVRIGEVETTAITSIATMTTNLTDMEVVYEGNLRRSGQTMTVTFTKPYIYKGKNLIIDIKIKNPASSYATCNWYGVSASTGSGYYRYGNNSGNRVAFLPTMTIDYTYTTWETTEEIDFGGVELNTPKELSAQINNPGEEPLTINLSATQPFGVNPTSIDVPSGATKDFIISFNPTQPTYYNGKLNLEINSQTTNVDLRGVGFVPGEKVVRDSAFFAGIEYTWPIVDSNGVAANSKKSNLSEIAIDPDQVIAMLRKVYMDQNIPGNLVRGYTTGRQPDETSFCSVDVPYTAAGKILATDDDGVGFDDTFGWNIPCDRLYDGYRQDDSNNYIQWVYMNPDQYKPKYEGVTLLLLEMVDTFKPTSVDITNKSGYEELRAYIEATIKSARVITEAKRTGTGVEAGTLFKIDCDKMNKFYLVAKGQLQSHRTMLKKTFKWDEYSEPSYLYGQKVSSGTTTKYDEYYDPAINTYFMLGHMFEQFSPALADATETKDDIYQDLTKNMESFGVIHDCPNVPFVENGHHFMMYGENSGSDDCQDVRDMMFFVPDYRMMAHSDRGFQGVTIGGTKYLSQDFFRYHPDHQPQMGMFVILQDSIKPEECSQNVYQNVDNTDPNAVTGLFHHKLQWTSNLADFLPSDEQYYELWEVRINDYGIEEYVPVYYRNSDGTYVYENGEKKPIILNRTEANEFTATNANGKEQKKYKYLDVYVDMHPGSQTKTYVIQGRDKGDAKGPFLSLQMSNKQSIIIPGTDPNEKVRMLGTTHYSRFNPQDTTNCYSNKLQIVDNTLTESELAGGLRFTRSYRPAKVGADGNVMTDANGNIQYEANAISETIATGSYEHINNTTGRLTITINPALQASKDKFPKPMRTKAPEPVPEDYEPYETYLDVAGYHANPVNNENKLTIAVEIKNGTLTFKNFSFWDNFTADVSQNTHPFQYAYKMYVGSAYSNDVNVRVYKTDSKINTAMPLDSVLLDKKMGVAIPGDVEFEAQVQYGSKTELLRVDAYRWEESVDQNYRYIVTEVGVNDFGNDEETDVAPDGQAANEGGYYTVRMNSGQNEYNSNDVPVSQTNPRGWAKFVDVIPQKNDVRAYDYAPVVETFNFGYRENKENGKWAERDDYNTYGGPMRTAAIGKLELKVYEPTDAEVHGNDDHVGDPTLAQMSDYKWYDGGKWYSYYNIYLNFNTLNVPEGYELYKVRAWRRVAEKDLGEEIETRQGRVTGDWYMYEDINYGDSLGSQKTAEGESVDLKMQLSNIGSQSGYPLGHRSTSIAKPKNPVGYSGGEGGGTVFDYDDTPNPNHDNQAVEDLIKNEMRATFGALRMKTDDCPDGIESLNAEFKVRAYFTKGTNKLIQDPEGSTNWGRNGKAQQIVPGSDFDYYIAEGSKTFELKSDNIITGVNAVKMDVNREVVSVSYVNTIGQVSSTPWQGINMVVTRYSDGSTTTKKVIR
jgi:hypothetical protein